MRRKRVHSYPTGFRCLQCGTCCHSYIPVTRQDILRWAVQGRDDILEHVSTRELFIHPLPRDELARCPFLQKLSQKDVCVYICSIHDTKPEVCAAFPTSREQAERIGCPGIQQTGDQISVT
jgi:Fe-S-cluster containining protein